MVGLTSAAGDPFFVWANYSEAALWGAFGVGFAVVALRRHGRNRGLRGLAAAAFIAFGLSDVVETHTGAWYKPWWLLLWKAACVAVLLGILALYTRRRGIELMKVRPGEQNGPQG